MPVIENPKAKEMTDVPTGYRSLGRCISETHRSYLFEYFGDEIFIPKSTLVKVGPSYYAPKWAIESAKKYNAERSRPIIRR